MSDSSAQADYGTYAYTITNDAVKQLIPISIVWCILGALLAIGVLVRLWAIFRRPKHQTEARRTTLLQDGVLMIVWMFFMVELALAQVLLKELRMEADLSKDPNNAIKMLAKYVDILRTGYTLFIVNIPCLWLSKLPLYILYLNLAFRGVLSKPLRWGIICGAVYHGLSFLAVFFSSLFACGRSVPANWEINDCDTILQNPQIISFLFFSVSGDIILIILGTLTVLAVQRQSSHQRRRELLAIAFILCMGLLSLSASVVRFSIVWTASSADEQTLYVPVIQWYSIEIMAATVACNLPSFRTQLRQIKMPWRNKVGSPIPSEGSAGASSSNKGQGAGDAFLTTV